MLWVFGNHLRYTDQMVNFILQSPSASLTQVIPKEPIYLNSIKISNAYWADIFDLILTQRKSVCLSFLYSCNQQPLFDQLQMYLLRVYHHPLAGLDLRFQQSGSL